MYIETSSPRKPGDYARLETPTYQATDGNGKCLMFWYHMYGSGIGRLNIFIKRGQSLGTPAWTMSGNQGNRWLRGMLTVKSPNLQWKVLIRFSRAKIVSTFIRVGFFLTLYIYFEVGRFFPTVQAVFEGIRGRGYRGDIAIDDSEVKNGPCPPPGSCDFERGLCAYQNDLSGDDFDWERNTGHTASIGTGPSIDHTTGTTKGGTLQNIKHNIIMFCTFLTQIMKTKSNVRVQREVRINSLSPGRCLFSGYEQSMIVFSSEVVDDFKKTESYFLFKVLKKSKKITNSLY